MGNFYYLMRGVFVSDWLAKDQKIKNNRLLIHLKSIIY